MSADGGPLGFGQTRVDGGELAMNAIGAGLSDALKSLERFVDRVVAVGLNRFGLELLTQSEQREHVLGCFGFFETTGGPCHA